MAKRILWNADWEFCEHPAGEEACRMPEDGFTPIDIPHDYMIYDTHALYRDSVGWYRKRFTIKRAPKAEEKISLRFDGVYMDTAVYVNSTFVGEWKYGYSTFEFDITPSLREGVNEVSVRIDYRYLNSRWYSGAGIFRNVWWISRGSSFITPDGIYITPVEDANGRWKVEVDTELELHRAGAYFLEQKIFEKGIPERVIASDSKEIAVPKEDRADVKAEQTLLLEEAPRLWDLEEGNLYELETSLYFGETLLEKEVQTFGFRTLQFDPEQGFLLNGRKVKLNGVCEHHDFGCLGAAFSKAAARRKLLKLRQMGVNAIRTSHNMPAPEFMELTDEMGFLVLSEAFDMWEKAKTTYDYARFFNDWFEKDVESWVRRDRNRASLLMWSIGNEIQDTLVPERGVQITRALRDRVRQFDPKRHAPVTIGSNFMKWENPQECAKELDCVGYNYSEYLYEEHHREHPDWVIYGSETASVLASRSIYHFPLSRAILTDEDEQCSALGNSITGWGAKSYEGCICDDRDKPFSMGQFIWTGFDYIGESTPYETKNSYFGQIDTAGFPKDSFYIFQAEWTDYKKSPMVHVFPYWDFNIGQEIDVQACSNAPVVELFLNGKSLGKHEIDHQKGRELVGRWLVPYEEGRITAIAYDETRKEIARDERHSFGDGTQLTAMPDKKELLADGQDMIFLEIGIEDAQGYPVENAKNRVEVLVEGAGRLIGLDNGDSADFDQHKGISRRLFGGKLLAVIGSKKEEGEIRVRLSSQGLQQKEILLRAVKVAEDSKAEEEELLLTGMGSSFTEENRKAPLYGGGSKGKELKDGEKEIPIRKVELFAEGPVKLTKEQPQTVVKARIYPQNATYKELEFRAMNETGIDVNFVELCPKEEEGERQVIVSAKGDGEFSLRCYARNGGSSVSVQSMLMMETEGFGKAFLDPYEEIPAGLCDVREGNCGEGILHGIGFLGEEKNRLEAVAGFNSLDFGDFGTEEITLPIFANTNDPVTFQIFEGDPRLEGSTLLADCFYHKKPEWMVFKEQSYRLAHRIKGNTPVYLATGSAFQLRGIYFTPMQKAFSLLNAAECDKIYGDSYQRQEKYVEQIGNNVSLEFHDMDFGTEGTCRITLFYRSELSLNPVQIRFEGQEKSVQVVEAPMQKEYGERTFSLEEIRGKGNITFIFMPGSCFDFGWFRFKKTEKEK